MPYFIIEMADKPDSGHLDQRGENPPPYISATHDVSIGRFPPQPSPGHPSPSLQAPTEYLSPTLSPSRISPGTLTSAPPQVNPGFVIARQFPLQFNLYKPHFSPLLTLGEHQGQPIYGVRLRSGLPGQPDVVLHSGPTDSHPMLAGVEFHNMSWEVTVHMPPLPGSWQPCTLIKMDSRFGRSAGTFSFPIEVGRTAAVEQFEWRHSRGKEVQTLGAGGRHGWKLVRMETGPPDGGSPGMTFVWGGASSDGKEVVAVCTIRYFSGRKVFAFRFLGTGSSGLLGPRWELMAVITALAIWERERQSSKSSSSG
jgi:hypothetical protein